MKTKQNCSIFFFGSFLFVLTSLFLGCSMKYKGSSIKPPDLGVKANTEQITIEAHYIIQPNSIGTWVKDAAWTEVGFSITNNSSKNLTISQIRLLNEKGVFLNQGRSPTELTKIKEELAQQAVDAAVIEGVTRAPTSLILSPIFAPLAVTVGMLPHLLRTQDREKVETEFRKRQIVGEIMLAPKGSIKGSGFFPITLNPKKLSFTFEAGEEQKEIEVSLSQGSPSKTKPEQQVPPTQKETRKEIESQQNLISQIQQKLIGLGYNPGSTDGKLGPKTKSAIKKYQKDKDLVENGEINQATLVSLGIK